MHKSLDLSIRGIAPVMFHNGQLCDPLNPFTRRMKEITAKRKKTDADFQALYDVEWEGGLYLDEERRVIVPGELIEGTMIRAAKKLRLGDQVKAGILSDGLWPLVYEGPKDIDKLRADPRFRDIRKCKVQRNSVMRCRPIFTPWSLKFRVDYLPDLLNEDQVIQIIEVAGRICGIGDYLPKYGRFILDN